MGGVFAKATPTGAKGPTEYTLASYRGEKLRPAMAVAPPTSRRLDVAVVADVHLGTSRARARELADYLASIHPRTLVVAGDLLDLAAVRAGGIPDEHLAVLRRLLGLAHEGTRVYLLTGNHDAALGRFGDLALGNLHVRRELELHLDGRRYFFCHGDRLEASVRLGLPVAVDSPLRRLASLANKLWWRLSRACGRQLPSLAHELRAGGSLAATHLEHYRVAAAGLAAERGCDTVVCAHVQRPEVATVEIPGGRGSVRYLNPGRLGGEPDGAGVPVGGVAAAPLRRGRLAAAQRATEGRCPGA